MTFYKLNEGVYRKIEDVLDVPKPENVLPEQTYYKSIYGPATLMNDWYEKRDHQTQLTQTEPLLSENMDSYRQPCKSTLPDRAEYFSKIFESYGLGQELLTDHLGLSFYNNYVTTYDLMYNHLNKEICGPLPRPYFKGHYVKETDLTNIFGNLTQWGLKEKVFESMTDTKCKESFPMSETIAQYAAYDLHVAKKLNDFQTFRKVKAIY